MKKIIFAAFFVVLLVGGFAVARVFLLGPTSVAEKSIEDIMVNVGDAFFVPTFTEQPIEFTHTYVEDAGTFAGGALIDVDGDGVDEIFIGGGRGQDSGLFYYEDGVFVDRSADGGLSSAHATYGSVSLDVNTDGATDLIVAREDGMHTFFNNGDGSFTGEQIVVDFAPETFPIAVTAGDINHDGIADLYISTFIDIALFASASYNDPSKVRPNLMLLGQADGTYVDVTEQSGTTVHQNTFLSNFVDLNNDGWQDLVVTPNTDEVYVFANNQDGTFTRMDTPSLYGFWMGFAVADVDNDGDQDLFFSNAGNTIPERLTRGDLRDDQEHTHEWLYLRNDGDFTFVDATTEVGLAGFEFAWGAAFADFNLDGRQDLSVAENYIKWAAHKLNKLPGRFFTQSDDGQFESVTSLAGVENEYFGQTPLVSDFTQDGYLDLVYVNLDGPLRVLINDGGENNYLRVSLPDIAASLGVQVEVTVGDETQTQQVITGVGMLSDQTNQLIFGLGQATQADVKVVYSDGTEKTFQAAEANSTVQVDR